jgi:hypothetical protein
MPRRLTDQGASGYPLKIQRGITWSRVFQFTNNDGTPVDMTGMSIVVHIRDIFDTLFVLSSDDPPTALGSEVVFTDQVNGTFRFKLTDEETLTANEVNDSNPGKWWMERLDDGDVNLLLVDCATAEDI